MPDNQGTTPPSGAQPAQDSSGMTFDTTPVNQDTPAQDSGMKFDSAPATHDMTVNPDGKPKFAPYDPATFGRYTTPENYEKWAAVPPKAGPNTKPGGYEAWTGVHLTPKEMLAASGTAVAEGGVAAGTALGAAALPEVLPAVLTHTIDGVKAIGAWASKKPRSGLHAL